MTAFLLVAGLLMVAVVAVLSYRLWRTPAFVADDGVDALGVLRDQKREVEGEVAAGRMTPDERETRLDELTQRVHDEALTAPAVASTPTTSSGHRRRWLAALIAVLVPVFAIPIYLVIGNPMALDPAIRASAPSGGQGEMSEEQIKTLLAQLKEKLQREPNDAKGWTMLGKGTRLVNDYAASAAAFERASALAPNDPSVLTDWADSLGMMQSKSLEGKPRELIQQALKIDPKYPKALALAASAEYAAGRFPAAKQYWERLLAVVPPDSEAATEVKGILAQLDQRTAGGGAAPGSGVGSPGKGAGTTSAGNVAGAAGTPAKSASPSVAAITGTVKLAPSLASTVAPGDTLYIFARAVDGPRMPLAIIRATAGELPKSFKLDDSMTMGGGPALSSIAQVKVEARISKSGDAIAKPGDLRGESIVLTPGMGNVEVVIDRVVP